MSGVNACLDILRRNCGMAYGLVRTYYTVEER